MLAIGTLILMYAKKGLAIYISTLIVALFFSKLRKSILRSLAGGLLSGVASGLFLFLLASFSSIFYLPRPLSFQIFLIGLLFGFSFGGLIYFSYLVIKNNK